MPNAWFERSEKGRLKVSDDLIKRKPTGLGLFKPRDTVGISFT
ncbi:hypothetical protein HMPREF0602_2266 [Neisseria meningitidis ATCC 13091]|uniref:Uncharacterized protein n=1 Tax=Neisseria meningitidis serogroup B (strain ATCC 13091 / M2091) TaxID=862513 RepID=E0NCN4_NEIM3|nr:hypothetical protein HMPREF0602_2266 [Neisseria meningitidis ATCC 13091]